MMKYIAIFDGNKTLYCEYIYVHTVAFINSASNIQYFGRMIHINTINDNIWKHYTYNMMLHVKCIYKTVWYQVNTI